MKKNLEALRISADIARKNMVAAIGTKDYTWFAWFYREMSLAYADGLKEIYG